MHKINCIKIKIKIKSVEIVKLTVDCLFVFTLRTIVARRHRRSAQPDSHAHVFLNRILIGPRFFGEWKSTLIIELGVKRRRDRIDESIRLKPSSLSPPTGISN